MINTNNKIGCLNIEDAHIMFRNFSGKESKYNTKGNRNFCVLIDDVKYVKKLRKDGWNVRTLAARDDDDEDRYYLQVALNFKYMAPKVLMITRHKKTSLTEETIDSLDYADIAHIDMVLRPYQWSVNGSTGIKAYLKAMYVTIEEDDFAEKYEGEGYDDVDGEDVPF